MNLVALKHKQYFNHSLHKGRSMKRYFLSLLILSSCMFTNSSLVAVPNGEQARAAAAVVSGIEQLGTGAGALAVAYVIASHPLTLIKVGTATIVAGGCIAATLGAPAAVALTTVGACWVCQHAWNKTKAMIKGN